MVSIGGISSSSMGGAGEIAAIMVAIKGDASDLTRAVATAKGEMTGLGDHISNIGKMAGLAFAGAEVAIAAFAIKSAVDVGGAMKTIQKETGLTGTALTNLQNSFKTIAANVPESFDTVAKAISDVTDKSKLLANGITLVGKPLGIFVEKSFQYSLQNSPQ